MPCYSINSSARARPWGGMSILSGFTALRLMNSSIGTDLCTGERFVASAALTPFSKRPILAKRGDRGLGAR
jgi:hypothetical protein